MELASQAALNSAAAVMVLSDGFEALMRAPHGAPHGALQGAPQGGHFAEHFVLGVAVFPDCSADVLDDASLTEELSSFQAGCESLPSCEDTCMTTCSNGDDDQQGAHLPAVASVALNAAPSGCEASRGLAEPSTECESKDARHLALASFGTGQRTAEY